MKKILAASVAVISSAIGLISFSVSAIPSETCTKVTLYAQNSLTDLAYTAKHTCKGESTTGTVAKNNGSVVLNIPRQYPDNALLIETASKQLIAMPDTVYLSRLIKHYPTKNIAVVCGVREDGDNGNRLGDNLVEKSHSTVGVQKFYHVGCTHTIE